MVNIKSNIKDQISKNNSSKGAATMAQLLAGRKSNLPTLHKRDIVKGIITKLTPSEILIDISGKSEAVVLEKDRKMLRAILSILKVGDEVTVSILNPESEFGNSVVSLRPFLGDLAWKKLEEKYQSKEALDVVISEVTRGGFLVDTRLGVSGFLPNSQISFVLHKGGSDLQSMTGTTIKAHVLEINRPAKKLIFSQKPILTSDQFIKSTAELKVGQKIDAIVSAVTSFGIFVAVPIKNDEFLDGLIHISEIEWNEVQNITGMFNVSQKIACVIIGIDEQSRRIELSIRKLSADPFDEVIKHLTLDQKVTGTVSKVSSIGIFIRFSLPNIAQKIEGLIRKEKIPPNVSYEVDREISATVSSIDKNKRRIVLVPVLKEKPMGYK